MTIVDTILADIRADRSHREMGPVIAIKESALRDILDRRLLPSPNDCWWCDHRHQSGLARPCSECNCSGPHNPANRWLPACGCGAPSVTIIGETAMCSTCVDKWLLAAAKWQSPVEPQSPAVAKAMVRYHAAAFVNAQPGEIWVVTVACGEHKGIVAEGRPFARQFGAVHPCRSGCVYVRVSEPIEPEPPRIRSDEVTGTDPRSTPVTPTPDDRPCVQTVNRFGHPLYALCAQLTISDPHGDCSLPAGVAERLCVHHAYLPTPKRGYQRGPLDGTWRWDCSLHGEFGGGYINESTAAAAGKGHAMIFGGTCPIVTRSSPNDWMWRCLTHAIGRGGYESQTEVWIHALGHFAAKSSLCDLDVRQVGGDR